MQTQVFGQDEGAGEGQGGSIRLDSIRFDSRDKAIHQIRFDSIRFDSESSIREGTGRAGTAQFNGLPMPAFLEVLVCLRCIPLERALPLHATEEFSNCILEYFVYIGIKCSDLCVYIFVY